MRTGKSINEARVERVTIFKKKSAKSKSGQRYSIKVNQNKCIRLFNAQG